jgi:hypothetical protein
LANKQKNGQENEERKGTDRKKILKYTGLSREEIGEL